MHRIQLGSVAAQEPQPAGHVQLAAFISPGSCQCTGSSWNQLDPAHSQGLGQFQKCTCSMTLMECWNLCTHLRWNQLDPSHSPGLGQLQECICSMTLMECTCSPDDCQTAFFRHLLDCRTLSPWNAAFIANISMHAGHSLHGMQDTLST